MSGIQDNRQLTVNGESPTDNYRPTTSNNKQKFKAKLKTCGKKDYNKIITSTPFISITSDKHHKILSDCQV